MSQSLSSSPISQLIRLLHHEKPPPSQLEITILPDRIYDNANDNYDDSDYYYLKDGIHLGIHAPNVPHLARMFRNEYYSLRKLYLRSNSNSDVVTYIDDNDKGKHQHHVEKGLWEATTCLLLLCPDHATAWSDRKRILSQQKKFIDKSGNNDSCLKVQHLWKQEIEYLNLLFTQHSKAPNAWSHRKWISKQLLQISHGHGNTHYFNTSPLQQQKEYQQRIFPSLTSITEWTCNELEICTNIAEKYPKNYYAWTHRRFVLDTLLQMQIKLGMDKYIESTKNVGNSTTTTSNNTGKKNDVNHKAYHTMKDYTWNVLQSEFRMIHSTWITKHVSDHSAVHYGGEVLRIMILLKLPINNFALVDDNNDDAYRKLNNFSFLRHYSYYHEFCYYNNGSGNSHNHQTEEENKRWIMDTLQKTLCQSQEFITKHPTNEVIWIWRRVCSQIYIHYTTLQGKPATDIEGNQETYDSFHTDSKNKKDNQSNGISMHSLIEEFVQNEIKTFLIVSNDDDSNKDMTMVLKDKYDQRLNKLYKTTYILWLLEHVKRQTGQMKHDGIVSGDQGLKDDNKHSERTKLEAKLIHSLGCYQGVSINDNTLSFSNIWSIKKKLTLSIEKE